MPHLHAHIADQVSSWKQAGFPCEDYPVIADILEHQKDKRHEAGIAENLGRDEAGQPSVTHEGIKAAALKRWTRLNPERLKYELDFASKVLRPGATDGAVQFTT